MSFRCCSCDRSGDQVELQPYGPDAKPICLECVMSDPRLEAEARRQFLAQLRAGTVPIGDTDDYQD